MTPYWALSIAYWLHMLATVVWVGGLTTVSLLVLPLAQRHLESRAYAAFLNDLQRRLDPIGWFSLAVLVASGLFQMSASPNYEGFLSISNRWAIAILVKHVVFIVMVSVSAYLTWGLLPQLRRSAIRLSQGQGNTPLSEKLRRQNRRLLRLNLIFAILVLALTALARAS